MLKQIKNVSIILKAFLFLKHNNMLYFTFKNNFDKLLIYFFHLLLVNIIKFIFYFDFYLSKYMKNVSSH
jgi:hypothetical protein